MQLISSDLLESYWSHAQVEANILILMNIVGALMLGMIIGYERSYHGRAAGIRTYGLVCMASAAMTVIMSFPQFWFGGMTPLAQNTDPTRVIQGIVTGIGFLGAGVIMKEGLNISGLTTAASIWASSAIGILCGAGFYFAAITLTLVATATMIWGGRLEAILPSRHTATLMLRFKKDSEPNESEIQQLANQLGYRIAKSSVTIHSRDDHQEWHLVLLGSNSKTASIAELATALKNWPKLDGFQVGFSRN